jgi:hypothetical protein
MTRRPSDLSMFGLALALLLLVPGCAQKADWVEGTLVTVDVTGVWKGRLTGAGGTGGMGSEMELTLTQRGAKVTGDGRIRAEKMNIEGIVRGDVFSFSATGGRLSATATVKEDEMSGEARTAIGNVGPGQSGSARFTLSR